MATHVVRRSRPARQVPAPRTSGRRISRVEVPHKDHKDDDDEREGEEAEANEDVFVRAGGVDDREEEDGGEEAHEEAAEVGEVVDACASMNSRKISC